MKYTAIECTYISSALRRWLVLSQMEHLRAPHGGSDGRKSARDTGETKPAKINVLFLWKAAERAPSFPLRSQDDARLVRVVSIVFHFIFFPFLVRHPGTFSALNSAGSDSVNALSTQSKCTKCTSAR